MNIIVGKNGAGKTNLLEAIYLLSTGQSFRTPHLSDLIYNGASEFSIEAHFEKDQVTQTLSLGFDGSKRKITYNNTHYSSFSHLLGIIPSVLYSPKDIELITGAPSDRRRFLNIQIAQSDPLYVYHLTRYHKAMKHRNALLKIRKEETMCSWEKMMALSATYLIEKREQVVQSLSPILHTFAKQLSRDNDLFGLTYSPSISMKKIGGNVTEGIESIFKKQRAKELLLGTTLNGPHRDDIGITYQNKEAKIYSSEGQKRTCISALKIAEWSHLAKYSGIKPLLSIDDFGVHLDENRSEDLHLQLQSFGQVFITTPIKQKKQGEPREHTLEVNNGSITQE